MACDILHNLCYNVAMTAVIAVHLVYVDYCATITT